MQKSITNKTQRKIYVTILLIISILSGATEAYAQMSAKVRTYTIHDGLPSNYITHIAQDDAGRVWIATWNGISFFDGYRFVNFHRSREEGASNRIYMLHPAGGGILWMLSYEYDPFYLDTRTGKFNSLQSLCGESVKSKRICAKGDTVWIIGEGKSIRVEGLATGRPKTHTEAAGIKAVNFDSKGNEWLYSDKGLRRYRADGGITAEIPGDFAKMIEADGNISHLTQDGIVYSGAEPKRAGKIDGINGVYDVKAYSRDALIVAGDKDIYIYNTKTGKYTVPGKDIHGANIYTDSRGRLWAISADDGIYMMQPGDIAFKKIEVSPANSPEGVTLCGQKTWLEDTYGTVWLGAKGDVFGNYNELTGTVIPYPISSRLHNNKAIPRFEVALVDKQNNLWLSSMHNLTLVNFCNSNLREVLLKDESETRSVSTTPDSSIWMGMTDGTLGKFDSNGRLMGYLEISPSGRISLSQTPVKFSSRIYSLHTDRSGTVWVGTKGNGIYTVDPDGTVTNLTHDPADRTSLPDNNIYDIDEDPAGNIWIATYGGGLALVLKSDNTPGHRKFHHSGNSLKQFPKEGFRKIRRITHTPKGAMIASTTDGLVTFDSRFTSPSAITFHTSSHDPANPTSLTSSHIMHTLATKKGEVYVAPLGENLLKVKDNDVLKDNLEFTGINLGDHPHPFLTSDSPAGNILSMAEGRGDIIYVVVESCVVAYNPETGEAHSIGYKDFDSTIEFTEASALYDETTGCIWAPSARGAFIIDPEKAAGSDYRPRISVSGTVPGQERRNMVDPERFVLPAGQSNLTLWIAALDYSTNELIQYAYRLDGEGDWVDIGENNSISVAGLDPGDHYLEIRSTDADGAWNDCVTRVEIHATPTFWQSIIGRILIIILVLALVGAVIYALYVWQKRPIANMLAKQKIMQESVFAQMKDNVADKESRDDSVPADDHHISRADRQLLQQLNTYIEAHLGDENLRIEDLADAMHMSRTVFYGKIRQLVGMSPSDFVRKLRMERARAMMRDGKLTVSEIAYALGFTDPKYFAKCFKKDTGMTPTEWRKSNREA